MVTHRVRLRWHDRPCALDPEGNETEDAAAPIATFGPGHVARPHPEGLRIHDASGNHVATFALGHVSRPNAEGGLHIHRAPVRTHDEPLGNRLAKLNDQNKAFWRPKR